MKKTSENRVYQIALTGLFAALSYVVFNFLQIKIYISPGEATSLHLGNAVCVLGALIMGGFYGGLGGAIGMAIGDLFIPEYVMLAPRTFVAKLLIGLVTGFVAHRLGRINESHDKKHIFRFVLAAAISGMLFNVIFDPIIGYYYKLLILGKPAAELSMVWHVAATAINAVASVIASVVIYMPLRVALVHAGLMEKLYQEK